ncbi:unnamed protein product [Alternaria alternata]
MTTQKNKKRPDNPRRRSVIILQSEDVTPEKPTRGRKTRHSNYDDAQPTTENVYEKPKRSIIRSGTARLKRRKLFPDSKPNEHTQVASPRSSPTGSSLRESTRTSEQLVDANDQTQDADDGLPSPITSNDLRLGDDLELDTASGEDLLMEEADTDQSKGSGTSSLHLGGRSIRARPRVSYVEQFPDDPSDLTAEDESESDVYVSSATDEESEADIELVSSEDEDKVSAISDPGSLDIMLDEESIAVEDDNPKPKPRRQHKPGESTRADKGIDLSLPPLFKHSGMYV